MPSAQPRLVAGLDVGANATRCLVGDVSGRAVAQYRPDTRRTTGARGGGARAWAPAAGGIGVL